MRKHWIDNLRWATVLLVLFYHVIYFYNNKGVFGGIGGFGEFPETQQYQDVVMYVLYPWFMPLLFLLAGMSTRYSLQRKTGKEWFRSRTLKLLVPSTIGLFVFHWMVGYFNTVTAAEVIFKDMPLVAKYMLFAISGTGPLWFAQDLWLFSLLFLMGYFVFSHDEVQEKVRKAWIPLMICAVIAGVILIVTTWGENNTSPQYLCSPMNCLYGWLMCLALMGLFNARYDCTNSFSQYMTRSSYGLYIVHYLVVAALGYQMKVHTDLPPAQMYIILTIAVFALSPAIYELLHRIPFVRWCVFGEKKR